jgi:lipopolysaccharide/colanic/teichoic acid biosynthesis glycosyltransferase
MSYDNLNQKMQYGIKLVLDKIVALFLLVFLSPLFLVISILIRIDSKGSVIFKQKRLGYGGKVFTIYKFRSMCENAVNMGDGIFVSKNDARITKIGKILRLSSMDELPQLVNILKGDMSFIGPRPPLEHHPYRYEDYGEEQRLRFELLPGITGYAQAYGRNNLTWDERIKMDVYYYKHFSIYLDLKIISRTFFAVLSSKGIYSNRGKKEKIDAK